jgi:hypothetical protein
MKIARFHNFSVKYFFANFLEVIIFHPDENVFVNLICSSSVSTLTHLLLRFRNVANLIMARVL